jgi:hypothetical protein
MSFAFYLLMSIMIFLFLCACTNLWIWLMHLSSGEEEKSWVGGKKLMIFQVMQLSQSKQAKLEATLDLLLSQNQAS